MAEPQTSEEKELWRAVVQGDEKKVYSLLNSNPKKLNDERYLDYYMIIEALNLNHISLAKKLVNVGFRAYKDSKSNGESTVLHSAVKSTDEDLIAIILMKEAGQDILYPDRQNKTPLCLAVDKNLIHIIYLFLAWSDIKTIEEKSFLHYAVERNMVQVVTTLIRKEFPSSKKNDKLIFEITLKNENSDIFKHMQLYCAEEKKNIRLILLGIAQLQMIREYVSSAGFSINDKLNFDDDTWTCSKSKSFGFTLLQLAVKQIDVDIVKFLLNKGADVSVTNSRGSSPLHIAFEMRASGEYEIWEGRIRSIIDLLLEANLKSESNPVDRHGLSHFHIACSRDLPTVVEHFLKIGVCVNKPVKAEIPRYKAFSPLHFAIEFRCKRILKILLKNGADVNQSDFMESSALHMAVKKSCLHTVRLLLKYNPDINIIDNQYNSPLHYAFEYKNYAIINLLLSVPNAVYSNPTNTYGLSHFHIACTTNNTDVVQAFIEQNVSLEICTKSNQHPDEGPISIEGQDGSGYSPLHFAVAHNRVKNVELLLLNGANVNLIDAQGNTPLHLACKYQMFDEYINCILCHTCDKKLSHVTEMTIKEYFEGFDTKQIDWTITRADHLNIINLLLIHESQESNVNKLDFNGNSPVFYAFAVKNLGSILVEKLKSSWQLCNGVNDTLSRELFDRRKLILNSLLELPVNFDKCYRNGSILHMCSESDDDLLDLFLKKGANVNATNKSNLTVLHEAVSLNRKSQVKILLDYNANVDCIDPRKNLTPLQVAAKSFHNSEIIQMLINKGANVNVKYDEGSTVLHVLASERPHDYEIVVNLVDAGADINSQDLNGLTPLHVACVKKNYNMIASLLKNGAVLSIEDKNGRSVCCYFYNRFWNETFDGILPYGVELLAEQLNDHISKMNVIGLPVCEKTRSFHNKTKNIQVSLDRANKKLKMIKQCEDEVRVLKSTKINDYYTLHDVILKNENSLSQFVKNPTFEDVVKSKTFDNTYLHYGYLIKLKYQAGLDRTELLPSFKSAINNLSELPLPDSCSEHICSYFRNVELKECIKTLSSIFNYNVKCSSNDEQSKNNQTTKQQKLLKV